MSEILKNLLKPETMGMISEFVEKINEIHEDVKKIMLFSEPLIVLLDKVESLEQRLNGVEENPCPVEETEQKPKPQKKSKPKSKKK